MLKRISDTIRFALSAVFHGVIAALYLAILLLTALFSREESEPEPVRCVSCNCDLGIKRNSDDSYTHYCDRCFTLAMQKNNDLRCAYLEHCLSLPEADR